MTRFLMLMLILGMFASVGILSRYSDSKKDWRRHSENADFDIDLGRLKNLYSISPEKYDLTPEATKYFQNYKAVRIGLSYSDYVEYLKWIEEVKAENKKVASLRAKTKFLESVHDDLTEYKNAAQNEFDEEIKKIQESVRSTLYLNTPPFNLSSIYSKDDAHSISCERNNEGDVL